MGDGDSKIIHKPFAELHHPFLMARWAEMAAFAGKAFFCKIIRIFVSYAPVAVSVETYCLTAQTFNQPLTNSAEGLVA
jgi:hypothetical protein